MLTGACGDTHGIVNNDWIEGGSQRYCAGDPKYWFIPGAKPAKDKNAGTPERLRSETVADVLKDVHGAKAKVFGLSLKDRSAILPTGRRPDGAYWFEGGKFGTSTYYAERVHPWVEAFNDSKFADQWFGRDWTHFRTEVDYVHWTGGEDDTRGEGRGPGAKTYQGIAFPHPTTGGKPAVGAEYYEALANSPFGNDLLLEFAKTCVAAEELGADDDPDLLVVSFSSNDLIGHTWGPDSHEVLDVTLRSDALMADFCAFLDAKVGRGQYLMGITADHGVCPLPEVTFGTNPPTGRVGTRELADLIDAHLTARFPALKPADKKASAWVDSIIFPWVKLNGRLIAASGQHPGAIADEAARALRADPEKRVFRTFTQAELAGTFPATDAVARRMQRSFFAPRCGELAIVLHPHWLPGPKGSTGTTHGTPFNYDTHVPLVVHGPGVSGGVRTEPTTPQAMASIFAKWLNVRRPKDAAFPLPAALE
jgi:hypothetical protein